ncbi:hypothetical protein ACG5V6_24660 [Streptomyces chitinivorans]|uniref:Integral membrane protein n=1 Tax=Streptomyces chitinivorans TaxID=1257027 RepID=A0ABW7HZP5_9ACTN|nr:hypothetical protein [Streptomyces chitinivorans]MDH2409701.1 hypothetical protein [Streptomyces chitinivorans]
MNHGNGPVAAGEGGRAGERAGRNGRDAVPPVRRLLALDAAGMAVVGLVYLAAAAPLGRTLGPGTAVVAAVGAGMLTGGGAVGLVARPPYVRPGAVRAVAACGFGWIALSLAVLASGLLDLTATGRAWTVVQTVPVGVLAVLQARAAATVSGGRSLG